MKLEPRANDPSRNALTRAGVPSTIPVRTFVVSPVADDGGTRTGRLVIVAGVARS